jgi:hypothetical protein
MKRKLDFVKAELKLAKRTWGHIGGMRLAKLQQLLKRYRLSVALGEVIELDNHWYVTHSGLIRLATRRRCDGIRTTLQQRLSDPAANRWVFKATVYKSPGSKGFVGYGDADPPMSPLWYRGPRCASRKHERSTAPCERRTASVSARSRNWGRSPAIPVLHRVILPQRIILATVQAVASPVYGISFVC